VAEELGARPVLDLLDGLQDATEDRPDPRGSLTPRELEVLTHLERGRTNGQIADTLFISRKTASVHVSNILAKLGAATRGEAVSIARRQGILS
ncbi:MAG TPA: LuxR C-terminal-related transcriptional regulator, partial [Candidatus Janibacter merdipullorum]|nr:LuxR C-terminal-related transcriptional regulator [Candidatus Janibacter merdipullorum]